MTNAFIRLLSIALLTLCLQACTENHPRAYDSGYDPARDPAADLQLAMADASAEGKVILLKLGGDWCSWCRILNDFIADSEHIYPLYRDTFVAMKVNVSEENENGAFLSRFPAANGYPYFIILDASGKLIGTQETGELESDDGYSEAKFEAFIRKYQRK